MMCELSVDDEGLQSEQDDGDRNWHDNWNTWEKKSVHEWSQNRELVLERDDGRSHILGDGWSQKLE